MLLVKTHCVWHASDTSLGCKTHFQLSYCSAVPGSVYWAFSCRNRRDNVTPDQIPLYPIKELTDRIQPKEIFIFLRMKKKTELLRLFIPPKIRAKKERHKSNCVLQNDRQRSWSVFPSAARASWPGLEQQNTEPLAWPQRNTSLLIQTKNKRGREMEACSASGAVCRCLIMVYTRCRSGFTAGHSWDETAGHGASTAASSCTLWSRRSGRSEPEAAGSHSLDDPPSSPWCKCSSGP